MVAFACNRCTSVAGFADCSWWKLCVGAFYLFNFLTGAKCKTVGNAVGG